MFFKGACDVLGFLAVANDVVDQETHTVFAFDAITLDALETLGIWFISELPFFVGPQHHYKIFFYKHFKNHKKV